MKKIGLIFCLSLLIIPIPAKVIAATPNFAKIISDSDISDAGYHQINNCSTKREFDADSDDWLIVSEKGKLQNYTLAYKTDGGSCTDIGSKKDVICVAGYAKTENHGERKNTCFKADRGWAGSWLPGNDNWTLDNQTPLADCPLAPNSWTKESADKTAVFVTADDKVITTKSGKPVRSLNTNNLVGTYNIKCIAYVCVDMNNNITYGEANGLCKQIPAENPNNNGSTGGNGSAGGNTSLVQHRNSVDAYLRNLKPKCTTANATNYNSGI